MQVHDAIELIELGISNDWIGLDPAWLESRKSSARSKPTAAAERRAAERRRDYVEDDAGLRILNQTG